MYIKHLLVLFTVAFSPALIAVSCHTQPVNGIIFECSTNELLINVNIDDSGEECCAYFIMDANTLITERNRSISMAVHGIFKINFSV